MAAGLEERGTPWNVPQHVIWSFIAIRGTTHTHAHTHTLTHMHTHCCERRKMPDNIHPTQTRLHGEWKRSCCWFKGDMNQNGHIKTLRVNIRPLARRLVSTKVWQDNVMTTSHTTGHVYQDAEFRVDGPHDAAQEKQFQIIDGWIDL